MEEKKKTDQDTPRKSTSPTKNKKAPKSSKKFGNKKRMKNGIVFSKELVLAIVTIFLGIMVVVGTSYAVFTTMTRGTKEHTMISGIFQVDFNEGSSIALDNTYPMSDEEGMKTDAYTFSIKNSGNTDAMYRIKLEEDNSNPSKKAPSSVIKISYKKNDETYSTPQLVSDLEDGVILETDQTLNVGVTVKYEVKMWVDEKAGNEVMGKEYKTKIVVEAVQKTERDYTDTVAPVIVLNGEWNENIAQGSSYTDPGVRSVVDNKDGNKDVSLVDISYEYYDGTTTSTVTRVNTNKVGVYYIYYRISDYSKNEGLAVRVVNVYHQDTTPPVLSLNGDTSMLIGKGESYQEAGYSASDDTDGDITNRVVTIGSVNTNRAGSYVIKYIVMDSSGNIVSKTRQVEVSAYTLENYFTFDSTTGTITGYSDEGPKDVVIPETIGGVVVKKIGGSAFKGKQLTSVILPSQLTYIDYQAFYNNNLTTVTMPKSVEAIVYQSFGSNQLQSVIIYGNPSIDSMSFGWASGYENNVIYVTG